MSRDADVFADATFVTYVARRPSDSFNAAAVRRIVHAIILNGWTERGLQVLVTKIEAKEFRNKRAGGGHESGLAQYKNRGDTLLYFFQPYLYPIIFDKSQI